MKTRDNCSTLHFDMNLIALKLLSVLSSCLIVNKWIVYFCDTLHKSDKLNLRI